MDHTSTSRPVYKASNKRNILIFGVLLNVAGQIALTIAGGSLPAYQLISILLTIGIAVAMLLWCHADARERDIKLGPGFRILIILLGPIAVIYYLFRSRGLKKGFIALGWMILYFILVYVIVIAANIIFLIIYNRLL